MHDTTAPWAKASSLLASSFSEILDEEGINFEEFESRAIAFGHAAIAEAISLSLERKDASLCAALGDGLAVHDRRPKTLASEIGDLAFSCRRARDRYGNTVVPLADFLDLPWCARVTPGARSFLVEATPTSPTRRPPT